MNAAAVHPLGRFAAKAIQEGVAFRLQGAGPGPRRLQQRPSGRPEEAVRPADQRHARRDRLHLEHLRRREHRRDGDGPGEEEGQRRHRRAALHQLALSLQGAREAGRRAAHRQAPQLGHRPGRHGQGHRPQHPAGVAGAGLQRQRLHARLQGRAPPWPTPAAPTSSPTSSRRSARCRSTSRRSASTSPPPAPTSGSWASAASASSTCSEDLQGTVLPTTRYGHRQVTNFNRAELTWEPLPGAARYETGGIAVLLAAAVSEGIDYVNAPRPRQDPRPRHPAHRSAADELPPLGYPPLTPRSNPTPILAFALKDADATSKALRAGKIAGDGGRQREAGCGCRSRCSTPTTTSIASSRSWADAAAASPAADAYGSSKELPYVRLAHS